MYSLIPHAVFVIQLTLSIFQIIDEDINPHVEQWEADGAFPAKEVFKKLGRAGLMGVTKPTGKIIFLRLFNSVFIYL